MAARVSALHTALLMLLPDVLPPVFPDGDARYQCAAILAFCGISLGWAVPTALVLRTHYYSLRPRLRDIAPPGPAGGSSSTDGKNGTGMSSSTAANSQEPAAPAALAPRPALLRGIASCLPRLPWPRLPPLPPSSVALPPPSVQQSAARGSRGASLSLPDRAAACVVEWCLLSTAPLDLRLTLWVYGVVAMRLAGAVVAGIIA